MRLASKVILAIVSSTVVLCSFVVPDQKRDHIEFRKECDCYVYLTYDEGKLKGWIEVGSDTTRFLRDGYSYYFSAKGDTLEKTFYFYGEAQGLSYSFYENGDTAITRKYAHGKRAGTWQYFDEQKHLYREEVYSRHGADAGDWPQGKFKEKYYDANNTLFLMRTISRREVSHQIIDTVSYNAYIKKGQSREGRKIFVQHCAPCHTPDKDVVGPKLAGVTSKRTTPWLKSWIKDAYGMVQSGDAEAVALYEAWYKTEMPAHDLTELDLDYLIAFLNEMDQK